MYSTPISRPCPMSQLASPTSVWSCPLLSPVESLQPPSNISQRMPAMCLFSSHEPAALSQAVPGDFLSNLLMNKEQQLKMLHSCLRSVLWEVGSLGGCVWCFLPKLWLSGCSVPGKEGDFGGIAESLSREDHDTQGSIPRSSLQSPSTHNSSERYAKLAEGLEASLPRQASLQVGFYIYVKQK